MRVKALNNDLGVGWQESAHRELTPEGGLTAKQSLDSVVRAELNYATRFIRTGQGLSPIILKLSFENESNIPT